LTIPVLVVTHSRLEGLRKVVDACLRAGVDRIYVAIDGPRDAQTVEIQSQMRSYLSNLSDSSDASFFVWERTENLGIAVSVITAIDWFFSHEHQGVILEDDLEFSDAFLEYSEAALFFFAQHEKFQIISGNRYDGNTSNAPVLVSYPQTWGWATWRNRWTQIRKDLEIDPAKGRKNANSAVSNFWQVGAMRVWEGFVDTWDLLVAHSMFQRENFCLLPPVNLVSNVGHDAFSTHTTDGSFPINFPIEKLDTKLIDFSSIILKPDAVANNFLENRVFRIKGRHHFLRQYEWLINLRFTRKYKAGTLIERLNRVLIP